MSAFIRPLNITDLDSSAALEAAAFPPAEAASRDKIEYRLSKCPELCFGLFVKDPTACVTLGDLPITTAGKGTLVAHVIATKSLSKVVQDSDMAVPPNWKTSSQGALNVGHQQDGRTVAVHALAVSPSHQGNGLGTILLKHYVEIIRQLGGADRISILTYETLIPYYEERGFKLIGRSNSNYGGILWNDMTYSLRDA